MPIQVFKAQPGETFAQRVARWTLGGVLIVSGISHLTFARRAFRAQVPEFLPKMLPITVDQVVVWSGVVEMVMGASLILLPRRRKVLGFVLGVFFIAILPGNVAQWKHHRSAFGLNTNARRLLRLLGQPALVAWALWSTGALDKTSKRRLQSLC